MNKDFIIDTLNKLLSERYDFKENYTNKYLYICDLVKKLKEMDYKTIEKDDLYDFTKIINLSLFKVIEINQPKLMKEVIEYTITILEHFNVNNYERYTLEIIESINKYYGNLAFKSLVQEYSSMIIFEFEKSKSKYFKNRNYHLYRIFCEEMINLYKLSNMETEHLKYEIGLSFHLEAINQQGRAIKSNHVKAHFLEEAEKYYKNKCQNIELAKDLRPIIKSCYGFVVREELQEFKTELPISTRMQTELYHYKRVYLHKLTENSIIKQLSVDKSLLPNYDDIVVSAKEIYAQSIFGQLCPTTPINEKRKLATYNGGDEKLDYEILQHYNLNLNLICDLRLIPIFLGMINNYRLNSTLIMKHISKWTLLDKSRTAIIAKGIDCFFKDDYISSINVLVPQIEHQLRYMFELIGFSTTNTADGKSQEEQTFSSFLKEKFVMDKLGKDIVKYFEIMFVSKIGHNIRNNVAHGFYDSDSFTKGLNIIVIYSLILLTRFNIKTSD